jgi:hypothetical protein
VDDTIIWGYEDLVEYVLKLQPKKARRYVNGERRKMCATPVIAAIKDRDGVVHRFDTNCALRGGKVRVSSDKQRSRHSRTLTLSALPLSADEDDDSDRPEPTDQKSGDGWSEQFQVEKIIDYCIKNRNASGDRPCLIIYSDAGISGTMPTDDVDLVKELDEKHAELYEEIFNTVVLDKTYTQGLTAAELASVRAYRDDAVAKIREGFSDAKSETDIDLFQRAKNNKCVLTGLIQQIPSGHTGDLLFAILGWVGEQRIRETTVGYFQGVLTALQSGVPLHPTPFWASTNESNPPTYNQANIDIMRDIVRQFMDITETEGKGVSTLVDALNASLLPTPSELSRGKTIRALKWTHKTLENLLEQPAMIGKQERFGRTWDTLRPILSEAEWQALQDRRALVRGRYKPAQRISEADRMATSLIRCICGRNLQHREHYLCCQPSFGGNHKTDQPRPYFFIDNVEQCLDLYIGSNITSLLEPLKASAQRISLQSERARLEAEMDNLKVEKAKQEEVLRPNIEAVLRGLGSEPSAQTVNTSLQDQRDIKALIEILDQKKQRLSRVEHDLSVMFAPNEIDLIEEQMGQWNTLTPATKNRVARRIFAFFQLEMTGPYDMWLVPTLREKPGDTTQTRLVRIPIVSTRSRNRWTRLLPTTEAELHASMPLSEEQLHAALAKGATEEHNRGK